MNIAFVLNATISNGGATKAFKNMLKGLKAYGVNPFVIVPDKDGIYQELLDWNIPVLVMTYRMSTYSYLHCAKDYLLFAPRMAAKMVINRKAVNRLATFVKNNHIDIIHTNVGLLSIGYRAARKTNIPHIYHIREYGDLIGYHYFPTDSCFHKQLTWKKNYTICTTKGVQQHYHLNGHPRSRVVYDSVHDTVKHMPMEKQEYFLFAGRVQPVKGLDVLLAAYNGYVQTTDTPVPLHIVGSTTADRVCFNALKHYVAEQGISSHVMFLGERDDVELMMQKAVATIVPSRSEGFGLCLPEAMLNGSLIIAHDTTGLKEQMDNGLEAEGQEIALRYETVEQLTALLIEVANSPASRYNAYRERAFRVVNNLYTIDTHVKQVYQFYNDILHEANT